MICLFIDGVAIQRSFILPLIDANQTGSVRLFAERMLHSGFRFFDVVTAQRGRATRARFGGGQFFNCGVVQCENGNATQMSHLEEHFMEHFGSKYQCPHIGCVEDFPYLRNLNRHLERARHADVINNEASRYIANATESFGQIIQAMTATGCSFDVIADVDRESI